MGSNLKDEKETDKGQSKEELPAEGISGAKALRQELSSVCGQAKEGPQAGKE